MRDEMYSEITTSDFGSTGLDTNICSNQSSPSFLASSFKEGAIAGT